MATMTSFKGMGVDLYKVFIPDRVDPDTLAISAYHTEYCLINPKTHKVIDQTDNILDMLKRIERRLDTAIEIASTEGRNTDRLFEDSWKFMNLIRMYHPAYNNAESSST